MPLSMHSYSKCMHLMHSAHTIRVNVMSSFVAHVSKSTLTWRQMMSVLKWFSVRPLYSATWNLHSSAIIWWNVHTWHWGPSEYYIELNTEQTCRSAIQLSLVNPTPVAQQDIINVRLIWIRPRYAWSAGRYIF